MDLDIDLNHDAFSAAVAAIVGAAHLLPGDLPAHVRDWRGQYHGRARLVARPADTAQVAALLRLCAEHGVPVVPQGGNTGLCGGAVPDGGGAQLVLCLSRLNRVRALDALGNTITVDAGCVLAAVQAAAAEAGRLFPLSLGAEGSCQIGGNIATNAGGVQVLRYGNMRELVLGLEVVLPGGEVLDLLRDLRKDNTGYDLKQLFIGSEGTLGVVTAATLKLFAAPAARVVAFAGLATPGQALALLAHLRGRLGDRFTAFELMSADCLALVRQHRPAPRPLASEHAWYLLAEVADAGEDAVLTAWLEAALEEALEAGLIEDVVLSGSGAQARALWQLREAIAEVQPLDGFNIKHDVSLPMAGIPAFLAEVEPALAAAFPGVRCLVYGHLGDGNLHFNVRRPPDCPAADWPGRTAAVNEVVHAVVARLRGSISAEHGIGQLKRDELPHYKDALELALMRRIKQALDPQGLMNPGKLFAAGA